MSFDAEEGVFRAPGLERRRHAAGSGGKGARGRAGGPDHVSRSTRRLPGRSYPNGCHIAEVEIDRDTGQTQVVRYTVVDDFGNLMNPMLAEGQVHGGVAQGIGQAITRTAWSMTRTVSF
jgi:carbon-monoxide dehydrogenase large subunit